MIEQGIYFALGCVVTALAALAFAPLFWRRALRLTRQRLRLQVPVSMQEILADRDALRADFAVGQLRAEQAMEHLRASKAQDMASIGRYSAEAASAASDVAELSRRESEREAELAALQRDLAERTTETGTLKVAIDDAHARIDRWRREYDLSDAERHRLQDEIVSHRTTIASLETRAMGLEMRLTDEQRGGSAREKSLSDSMRGRLESAMAQARRHETSGLLLRRELDEARSRIRTLEEREGSGSEDDDGGLRASIHALGLAVATMTRSARLDGESVAASGEPPARRLSDPAPAEVG